MAGMGKRMRPHTLTTAKPLLPIAGKSIVERLVSGIANVVNENIGQIAFIISESFGSEVEQNLLKIAKDLGANGSIHYQKEALGTAHAIYEAKDALEGEVIVAFADTLFRADFHLDKTADGVIWVQSVEDPRAFGVVKLNEENLITDFVEKPETFVSDLAIIGIYYFKSGETLRSEIKYLLDNDIKEKGEYQLTNALENMKAKGLKFKPGKVTEWWDCGNKNATVYTNQRFLATTDEKNLISPEAELDNVEIIEPCFIADGVQIINSKIGPFVSIGRNTTIHNSHIENSIIQEHSTIDNATFTNSMIGNHVIYNGKSTQLSLGDFSTQVD